MSVMRDLQFGDYQPMQSVASQVGYQGASVFFGFFLQF